MPEQHSIESCPQEKRLERIEEDMHNHRAWRNERTVQLTNMEVILATINERLKNIDQQHAEGRGFRTTLIVTIVGVCLSIMSALYAHGQTVRQIEVNTHRLDLLEGKK